MKFNEMSDTSFRNTTRTPNILQNVELSPTPSSKTTTSDTLMSPGSAKAVLSPKIQTLKQRKADLDKLLAEKYNLLQQLCNDEAQLLGCYPLNEAKGIDTNDGMGATLRRKVDTSFKLPENLLNSKEDDINKLLLSRQIQQQISEASLKLANDANQTKSIRRTHRQNYEAAQQKLQAINQRLSMLKKRPNTEVQEEININMNYNKYNNTNINNSSSYSPNNNNININHGSLSGSSKFSNTNNNNNGQMERRNSTISTGSSQQAYKPRSRCDSYSGVSIDYTSHSGKMSPSTSSTPYYNTQIYGTHNHIADKVMYVTNAVANAAAQAQAQALASNRNQNAPETMASPKYGRLRKPLTVDTNSNIQVSQTQKSISSHSPHQNRFYMAHNVSENIQMDDDSDDDIAGQYATLLTVTSPSTEYHRHQHQQQSQLSRHPSTLSTNNPDNEPHYSTIMSRSSRSSIKNLDNEESQLEIEVLPQSQGLGGYWMILDNNERIWCPLDNKYSSLDRKSQKNKVKKQVTRHNQHPPTKSTSLGNFNFIHKQDDTSDAISVTSAVSDQRKVKEKQWLETSLDSPTPARKPVSPIPQQPISPPIYYRDKNKLSSQSMHSPGRNAAKTTNTIPLMPKQYNQKSHSNLDKSLSTSATILNTTPDIVTNYNQNYNQQLSPPYYHHTQAPQSRASEIPATFINNHITSEPSILRRTASSVSSTTITKMPHVSIVTNTIVPPPLPSPNNNQYQSDTLNRVNNNNINNNSNNHNNSSLSTDIHIESPKNMTVIQPAKFQPYKEVTKPFEMSDFYKYSTKFRQKNNASVLPSEESSPQLPPKNSSQKHIHNNNNNNSNSIPPIISTPSYSVQYQ